MDRQFDMKRPQGTSWSPVTPATPTFAPTKFTPGVQQQSWKPFPASQTVENNDQDVIRGSVKVDPSGGYVHTFGAPRKDPLPQNVTSNASPSWHNNQSPSRQESVTSPRYVQEIIVPTANQASNHTTTPVRQTSFQNNSSQFSPQVQSPAASNYYQNQNNGYDRSNSSTPRHTPNSVQTTRQTSIPHYNVRQDSIPHQVERQSPVTNQSNSWMNQNSAPYQQQPSRQSSWNQQSPQVNSPYSPSQQTYLNQPVPVMYRQDSLSNPGYPNSRQSSFNSPPVQVSTETFQPSTQGSVGGLFSHQNSTSPRTPEEAVRYEPVVQNSTPGLQRQSSIQYQPSPKPYTPSPSHSPQPNFNQNSPQIIGAPKPFFRQQSSSGSQPQPWSAGQIDCFPTPPPFSPSVENTGVAWPSSSDLPTPPPPTPPVLSSQVVPPPPPLAAPPPPPPPPPPPMPSSAGISHEIPAWKKQIQATKEAKAAAGIPSQTPGTPGGAPEIPAALANSMKKDKKPFTYLPGGLDLSEIRSPKMQRRLIANQQQAPPPPSCTGQQVLLQPQQQVQPPQNQFDRLNLADDQGGMATAVQAQRQQSADNQDPRNYGQSRSFRLLQMMTGGDDATDSAPPQQVAGPGKREDDEMRFTGLRRPDNPIPSRAFQTLQKMTAAGDEPAGYSSPDNRYQEEEPQDPNQDGPVDIRYKGGYIPGRSFKMLQEITGMNEDGTPTGTVVPSVLQQKREQRKPPAHLHLNINQPPPTKQFPQPQVPASQQASEQCPKMYTGGKIPSRSFRMLQAMTGENAEGQGEQGTDM